MAVEKIIFACVHNAGRSQMAAALFRQLADPSRAAAISAGTQPAAKVHPEVVAAMRELDVDLQGATPQRLTPDLARDATWLVTMGCGEECPIVPGVKREDWPLQDPKGQDLDAVRSIRDQVRARVEAFVRREGYGRIAIEQAERAAVPEILAFLAANQLPSAGLATHATDLLVARDGGRLVATAALEIYGRDALLRSVAVDATSRGTGLGRRITRSALDRARERGVQRVFLLTETAAAFFPKFGFADIERSRVPDSIRSTVEFASACPASARAMMLDLA
jgi:protein-tyrosine-phosphatase/N-acetylglutamate synthase-like GNAT family acetyltransferase